MLRGIFLTLILSFIIASCDKGKDKGKSGITFNIGGEPTTLNPLADSDGYTPAIHAYIFETLLTYDLDTHDFKPYLAKEWTISEDKKTFDFTLRDGVKWHDGQPLTAEDVKFSYDVIFTDDYKAVQRRPFYESIKEVQILAPNKVRFIVKDDYFLNFDVCAGLEILPKHFFSNPQNKSDFGKKLIGTGPYIFSKYDKGQKITLVKNADWWGLNDPENKQLYQNKKINFKFSKEESVSLELLKKGDIDYLGLTPDGYMKKTVGEIWDKKIVKVQAQNKTPKGFNFIGFNLKNSLFKDKEVRKALSMLFNRPLLKEKFEYNLTEYATGPIYVQSDYANPSVTAINYNPQEAISLLKKTGWGDSDKDGILDKKINGRLTKLSFTIMEPNPDMVKYLTIFKEDAAQAGVEVLIKNIEWNSFVKLLDERNFEAVRLAWGGGSVEWDPKQIWHSASISGAGSNFISYSNPVVDKLIDTARRTHDKTERIKILHQVHQLISDDYPYIWFFNPKYSMYGHTKRIQKPKDTFVYGIGTEYWVTQ